MSQDNIALRRTREATDDRMAQYESPDVGSVQEVCTMYAAKAVAEALGEFAELSVIDADDVEDERQLASLTGISGNGTGNYAIFETQGGAVTGLYIAHESWADALGQEVERDEEGAVENPPETVGLNFAPSDESAFEQAQDENEEQVEEEATILVGGETEQADSDKGDGEEVEISDEELGIADD